MDELLIGVASRDITPPVGSILVGYHSRTSTSVASALRAEAMAVRQGSRGWVLLTADLCALSRPFVQAIRARIAAQARVAPEAIMIAADHTHSGPAANKAGWVKDHPDQPYFDTLARALETVALEAWSTATPGHLEAAATSAPDLASNRRVLGADGKWINDWVDPEGRHTGPFDSLVTLLGIRGQDGRLAGLLVTYGCHPVVMGPKSMAISADYCGALKHALEERGVAGTVLFAVSGHGDIDPRVCVQNDPREADRMGGLLAGIVAKAVADLRPLEAGPVAWHQEPWSITRTHGMEETADMQFLRLIGAGEVFETEVTALRCGSLAIVGLPGEALTQIVSAVRRQSPFDHTVVLSLANDTVGYLPTDEVQRQGSHEANYAPATGLEGPLLERARAALRAVEQSKGGVS